MSFKLWLLVGVFSAGFLLSVGYSLNILAQVKVTGPIYQEIIQQKDLLAGVMDLGSRPSSHPMRPPG